MKRLSYISNELIRLKNYLTMSDRDKAIELAMQNPYMFTSFLQQREDLFKEELGEDVYIELVEELDEDVTQHGEANYKLINALPENVLEEFYNWGRYADDPYAPSFLFMEYVDIVKNQWLIHFTNDAYSVATEGFSQGTPNYTHLGLTTWFTEEYKSTGGYNFAYLLSDYLRHGFERHGPKYGKEAVIFRASGIQVYHYGDQEPQVIFDGASAQDIVPIYEADGTWFTGAEHPRTEQPLYQAYDIDKVVDWIVDNFDQYKRLLLEGENKLTKTGLEDYTQYRWDKNKLEHIEEHWDFIEDFKDTVYLVMRPDGFDIDFSPNAWGRTAKIDMQNKQIYLDKVWDLYSDPRASLIIKAIMEMPVGEWKTYEVNDSGLTVEELNEFITEQETTAITLTKEDRDMETYRYYAIDSIKKLTFYHATIASAFDSIMENGLLPSLQVKNLDKDIAGWSNLNINLQDAVYLTTNPEYAKHIAETLAYKYEEDAIIFEIPGKVLDDNKLVIDEDALRDVYDGMVNYENVYENMPAYMTSLFSDISSLGYAGIISPEDLDINSIVTYEE